MLSIWEGSTLLEMQVNVWNDNIQLSRKSTLLATFVNNMKRFVCSWKRSSFFNSFSRSGALSYDSTRLAYAFEQPSWILSSQQKNKADVLRYPQYRLSSFRGYLLDEHVLLSGKDVNCILNAFPSKQIHHYGTETVEQHESRKQQINK